MYKNCHIFATYDAHKKSFEKSLEKRSVPKSRKHTREHAESTALGTQQHKSLRTQRVRLKNNLPYNWRRRVHQRPDRSFSLDQEKEHVFNNGNEERRIYCRHILLKHKFCEQPKSRLAKEIVRTKREAILILSVLRFRLLRGEVSFSQLARNFSDCCSARHSGCLSPIKLTQTIMEYERVILSLPYGILSEIFETRMGFHLAERMSYPGRPWRRLVKIIEINNFVKEKMHKRWKPHIFEPVYNKVEKCQQ